ncbi:MAG TPA: hypothetical protein VGK74_08620 [Symbiobacteriaceae bacterium]
MPYAAFGFPFAGFSPLLIPVVAPLPLGLTPSFYAPFPSVPLSGWGGVPFIWGV